MKNIQGVKKKGGARGRETREGGRHARMRLACVAVVSVSFSTKDARGHWVKRSKKVGAGGGGAGKGRKHLPLSPDILPNAVRQRTGGNDVLPWSIVCQSNS